MTISDRDARKRLLINRHIAKMTPEEIGRRFTVYVLLEAAVVPRGRRKAD
jgi:hypothetical protein